MIAEHFANGHKRCHGPEIESCDGGMAALFYDGRKCFMAIKDSFEDCCDCDGC